jgi:hypothetical protein
MHSTTLELRAGCCRAGFHPLRVELVSMYIDQCPEGEPQGDSPWGTGDIGTQLAAEHGVPIYSSINLALCCGGSELAVDGVIMIGEHGDYPWNEKGQHLFPRKYFMEQICGVFSSSGRSVPVFNDKHLSYSWHAGANSLPPHTTTTASHYTQCGRRSRHLVFENRLAVCCCAGTMRSGCTRRRKSSMCRSWQALPLSTATGIRTLSTISMLLSRRHWRWDSQGSTSVSSLS